MKRNGQVLIENVVFIILNLVFLSIMVVFLMKQASGGAIMEETYAKQVALLVDSAKPGMIMQLNMQNAYKQAKQNNYDFNKIFDFSDHVVTVALDSKSSYSYHYFNDVNIKAYPALDASSKPSGMYVISVTKK
jgi:hypothetical protein